MKKVNVKKLNQFMMNMNNSESLRNMVEHAVNCFLSEETPNVKQIALLNDLGLLTEAA